MNRYDNALSIQNPGACNLSGISRTLVESIVECHAENGDPRTDPAIRLIVHQMSHLTGIGDNFTDYAECMHQCKIRSPKYLDKMDRFMKVAEKYTHMKRRGEFKLEFQNTLDYQWAIQGTIDLEYTPRIEFHAVRNQDMAGEWVPTGFGLCGEARTEAKERVTELANDISKLVDGYVGVYATDDPGLF
jgi:hypothetical protein